MKKIGIYTLANDVVCDQLVALINSIEANVSLDIPICIIPYDQRLDLVKQFVNSRENITLYDNWESLQRWDKFAEEVWAAHPAAKQTNLTRNAWYKSPLLRKLAAYDGEFEQFVFYDADSLAMKPLDSVWQKLETYDFVFDDWEHIKPRETAALDLALIEASGLYQEKDIRPKLHCSSFFASKQGIFSPEEMLMMKKLLIEQGEIAWVTRWWDDAFLFNYLTLRCHRPFFNFTLSPNGQEKTGNCANADPFVNIDNVLYNKDGLKPIHRLHYMGYTPTDFARLSRGEDVNIRYRDEFLYYRFLKQPEQKPQHLKPPSLLSKTNRFLQKVTKKVQRTIS
ncbi:Npun_R2821/Npun_R2822 family protein [Iningainema tapete]|uniref:Methionine synthase n=1 Tax=Iningainema tapete BLCC-T55 TaxID=2748662 RepID=A0A8J6XIB4_9CYAN|nr:Npun_R2821/Npun_R2822 family protein [Iningainema tapete]MBD2771889.1 methionine synthase [Iningainema tapete BLCC-T55]